MLKYLEMSGKDSLDDFIVGFGFRGGGVSLNYLLTHMASEKDKGGNKMKKLLFGTILFTLVIVLPIPTMAAVDIHIRFPLPPPIIFPAPPAVIVIPDTYVYVDPDIDVDLFFWNGWWWRLWEGRWYRSHYYNRGWGYYDRVPSFYFDVDPGWRGYYRDHNWYGHRWNYERIPNQRLQQNWNRWHKDRHWERQRTWGVQGYQPRPQQQRQEVRHERQQQYQHRPEVQRHQQQRQEQQRQPQVQKPQGEQQRQPQVKQRQQPQPQPQVQGPQRQPQQPQQQSQPKVQQPQRQQQPQQQHSPPRGQQHQGESQHQQSQEKPQGGDAEHRK